MRFPLLASLVGLLLLPSVLAGAEDSARPQEPRVRVTSPAAPSGLIVGTLVGLDEETLTVRASKQTNDVPLKREAVTKLEVSRRRGNRGKAVAVGALVGAAVGVTLGLATGSNCQPSSFVCFDKGEKSVIFGLLTVPAGALLGLAVSHGEKWETTTPDRLRVAITPKRGGVGLTVSFGF